MIKRWLRKWLGIDDIDTKISNVLTAHDIIVNYSKKRLFHGKLETMQIEKGLGNSGTLEATIKFKAKDLTSFF